MLDVVVVGPREVSKWWHPIGAPQREWTDAVNGFLSVPNRATAVAQRYGRRWRQLAKGASKPARSGGPFAVAMDPATTPA